MIDLSNCIFKYGPAEYVERTLTDQTLFFSRLDSYNDIYEDEFHLILNIRQNSMQAVRNEDLNPAVQIRTTLESELEKYLVTCFSKRADISLMWAHYANEHSGVCYCFEYSDDPSPIFDSPINHGRAKYSNCIPDVNVYQEQTKNVQIPRLLMDVVLTKPLEWAYEEEIRFWYNSTAMESAKFIPESLKALIIGRRMSSDELELITAQVAAYNDAHSADVKVLYAYRQKKLYELGICDEKPKREWAEVSQNNSSSLTVSAEGESLLSLENSGS